MSEPESSATIPTSIASVWVKTEVKCEPIEREDEVEVHVEMIGSKRTYDEDSSEPNDDDERDEDFVIKKARVTKSRAPPKPLTSQYVKKYQCPQCPYITAHRHALKSHKAMHDDSKPFTCDICEYSTKYSTSLRRHKIFQHDKKPEEMVLQECRLCDYKTPFKFNLKVHLRTHHDFKCKLCGVKFKCNEQLEEHVVKCKIECTDIFVPECQLEEGVFGGREDLEEGRKPRQTRSQKPVLECENCDYTTVYKATLEKHMRKHTDDTPVHCDLCDFKTKNNSMLQRHKNDKHPIIGNLPREYICPHCPYKSFNKVNYKMHQRKHSVDKPFKCTVCPYETAYKNSFLKHNKSHSRQKAGLDTYDCDKCPFKTKFEGRLVWHLQKIHKEIVGDMKKCDFCEFRARSTWRLTIHKQRSKRNLILKCQYCDFQTEYKCHIKAHERTHLELIIDNINQKAAEVIDKVEVVVKEHIDNKNLNDPNLSLNLSYITDEYVPLSQIKVLETLNSDKPYSCYQCSYSAKYKSGVQRHYQRHHSNIKPFRCPHCDFQTCTKDSINLHMKRSYADRVLMCECGNYTTSHKCALINHQKTHNAYRCSVCTYSSRTKHDLERHYLSHTKGFLKCRFCDYEATRKQSLLAHETFHTGTKPFKCKFCTFTTVRESLLHIHLRKTHADLMKGVNVKDEVDDDNGNGFSGNAASEGNRVSGNVERVPETYERVSGVSDRVSGASDRLSGASDRLSGVSDRLSGVNDGIPETDPIVETGNAAAFAETCFANGYSNRFAAKPDFGRELTGPENYPLSESSFASIRNHFAQAVHSFAQSGSSFPGLGNVSGNFPLPGTSFSESANAGYNVEGTSYSVNGNNFSAT